jgi:c-di-GMP-binding flagellar brake protein YcgR
MTSENSENRRKFQRVLFDADTRIVVDSVEISARLIDISLNGALLERPKHWATTTGQKVTISITLDQEEEFSIQMEAEVAHTEESRVGLHCKHIDMDSITNLRRLLELNLGDPGLLERELASLG